MVQRLRNLVVLRQACQDPARGIAGSNGQDTLLCPSSENIRIVGDDSIDAPPDQLLYNIQPVDLRENDDMVAKSGDMPTVQGLTLSPSRCASRTMASVVKR